MSPHHHHPALRPGRWLALALLLTVDARSQFDDPPLTLPGEPRLGGCAEIAAGRVCRIDRHDPTITIWWPVPRTTDIAISLDGEPYPLSGAGQVDGGIKLRLSITTGDHELLLSDLRHHHTVQWRLVPRPERPLTDPDLWCSGYEQSPPEDREKCEQLHIERLADLGEDPFALWARSTASFSTNRKQAAVYAARASEHFLARGEFSLAVDALHSVAFALLALTPDDPRASASTDSLLAAAARILRSAQDQGSDYAQGEAYQAYIENQLSQARGELIYAHAWASRALLLMRRISEPDAPDLTDIWPQALDMAISAGKSLDPLDLYDFKEHIDLIEDRAVRSQTPADRQKIRCDRLAPLYINYGWLLQRLAEASDPAKGLDAYNYYQKGLEAYRGCHDEVQRASFHLAFMPTLFAQHRHDEAAELLAPIQEFPDDAFGPDNRALRRWASAMLDVRVRDPEGGLRALNAMSRNEPRPDDRWRAAISVALEVAESQPDAASVAFRTADRVLAATQAPHLNGVRLDDPRRNGSLRVAHLLQQGDIEEAACAAREAKARRVLANRWIAARSQASTEAFATTRQLRDQQRLHELAQPQLSEVGRARGADQIRDFIRQIEQSLQLAFANARVPDCVQLGRPAHDDVLVVIQPLPDGREAVFSVTANETRVTYFQAATSTESWALLQQLDASADVYLLADDPDAGAARVLAARPRTFLSIESMAAEPFYASGVAQLWHSSADGLDSGPEISALAAALQRQEWQVVILHEPMMMVDTLLRSPAPEFLYIASHGSVTEGLRMPSGVQIRDIDVLLARSAPRVVVIGACDSERIAEALLLAGSEMVLAGRGQLADTAASHLLSGPIVRDGHEIDVDALQARAAERPAEWRRFKKFHGVAKR